MSEPPSAEQNVPPKGRRRGRQILFWSLVAVFAAVLIGRAVLTTVLVRAVVSQLPAYIHGQIEIDDLDVQLYRGGALLEGVRLYVDGDPDPTPAVSFDSLRVRVRLADLLTGRINFGELHLVKPDIRLSRDAEGQLVLLGLLRESQDEEPEEVEQAAEGPPLQMHFDGVRIEEGRLRYAGLDFSLDAEAGGWHLAGDGEGTATLTLRSGDKVIALDVVAAIADRTGELDLTWSDIDARSLGTAFFAEVGESVRSAMSEGELTASLDEGAGEGRVLRGQGRVVLSNVDANLESPEEVAAAWKTLVVPIKSVEVPFSVDPDSWIVPRAPAVVRLGEVALASPRVTYIRRPAQEGGEGSVAEADDAGPGVDLTIEKLALQDGLLRFIDRTVKPTVEIPLDSIQANVAAFALTPLSIESFEVKGQTLGDSPLSVTGGLTPKKTSILATGSNLSMLPLDGYLRDLAEVRVNAGRVSVESRVTIAKKKYRAPTELVFSHLSLSGGGEGTAFMRAFGMPVGVAVAMLRDYKGEVALDLPIKGTTGGSGVSWSSVFMNAMRGTLTAALASPLNALGAVSDVVLGSGSLLEERIAFRPGKADLGRKAQARLDAIATLLENRSAIVVEVEGFVSQDDLPGGGKEDSEASGNVDGVEEGLAGARAKAVLDYLRQRVKGLEERSSIEAWSGDFSDKGPAVQVALEPPGRF